MTQQELASLIRDVAKDFRQLKTKQYSIYRKYPTREDKARFLACVEAKARERLEGWRSAVLRDYGFDPLYFQWRHSPVKLTDTDKADILKQTLLVHAARLHIASLYRAGVEAEKVGRDPIEEGFATWLTGRVLVQVYIVVGLMQNESIPQDTAERAIGIVSGYGEAFISLNVDKRLEAGLRAYGGCPLKELRRLLPGAILVAWDKFIEPENERYLLKHIYDALKDDAACVYKEERLLSFDDPALEGFEQQSGDVGIRALIEREGFRPVMDRARLSKNERQIIEAVLQNPDLLDRSGNVELSELLNRPANQIAQEKMRAFDKLRQAMNE